MTISIDRPVARLASSEEGTPPVEPVETVEQSFIKAFRSHPGGVVVITGTAPDGSPVGFTATSLASLSAFPPRATFNIIQSASSWPAITVGSRLAVHFLGEESKDLARRFATAAGERFTGDHWYTNDVGLPILRDAVGVLITRVTHQFPIDLNAVVIIDIESGAFSENRTPLLYHNRTFGTVAEPPEYII